MNFRFKATEVRELLVDYGLPFAETPSKPLLALPVYQSAGALLLWDDPNPWREAWKARPPADGLVPLVLPLGDLQDMLAIGAEQALNGDEQRLTAVAGRYGAGDTLVVHGALRTGGRTELEVFVTRFGSALQEQTIVTTFSAEPGEAITALLGRAAADIAERVEDAWKRDNLLQFGLSSVLAVAVPIGGLGDWLDVRKRLSRVAVINRTDLVLLSREEVRINLHFLGEADQLILALAQADLELIEEEGGWILKRARTARANES